MVTATFNRMVIASVVFLVAVGAFAMPVSASEGDKIVIPGDDFEKPGTCFPGDMFLPAVQFGEGAGDRFSNFPPGGVNFPGDMFSGTPGASKICSKQ